MTDTPQNAAAPLAPPAAPGATAVPADPVVQGVTQAPTLGTEPAPRAVPVEAPQPDRQGKGSPLGDPDALVGETDATVWAAAYAARFGGDEGTLTGWFANAIEAGGTAGRTQAPVLRQSVDLQREVEQVTAERDVARRERDEARAALQDLHRHYAEAQDVATEPRIVTPTNPHTTETQVEDAPLTTLGTPPPGQQSAWGGG